MSSDDQTGAHPPPPVPAPSTADADHLKLLAVFHFVYAGLIALGGCCGGIYVILGFMIASGNMDAANGPPPPREMGWFIAGFGGFAMLLVWGIAALVVLAGRKLLQRRARVYCMVVAGVMCMNIPIGTALGVFTLIVLSRPSVTLLFEET